MARVCMVAYTGYPRDTRVRREAEALVDRGDVVDVICLRNDGEEKVRTLNGDRLFQVITGRYRGSSALAYLTNYCRFFLAASVRLASLHLKQPYQVIQVHTMPDFMVFTAIFPKLLGAKVILDVHDLMPELYQSKFELDSSHWLVRLLAWMERRSVSFADEAIAVHKPHLDVLVRHGNPASKFIILLNLPDPKIFSKQARDSSARDGSIRLIYHGTVVQRNGLRVALGALAQLKSQINGLKFLIIGVGEDLPHLRKLAAELDLADRVSIEDSVPPEEVVPIILDADIGVVPILNDAFTKYVLPVKLLEYVALGIPVICSRTETIEAYFNDSMVQYVEPGNVGDLAEKLLDLCQDPIKRQRLTANADRFNRDYNWERQKQQYYRLMDDLVKQATL